MNIPAMSASTTNICFYAAFLARSLKYTSVKQYISTTGLLHKEFGLTNPLTDNYFLSSLLNGIRRVKGDSVNQKLPITLDLLFRVFKLLNFRSSIHSSFWAICLTAFFGMFRKSNILPTTKSTFSSSKQLCKSDFTFFAWGVSVHLNWSKTIQFRDRIIQIPFSFIPNSPLCPVKAISHAFSFDKFSQGDMQAFCYINLMSGIPVIFTCSKFLSMLRAFLYQLGIDASQYAGHSFRRGGATFAHQAGLPVDMIKLLGDWKSDAVLLYLTVPFHMRFISNLTISQHIAKQF